MTGPAFAALAAAIDRGVSVGRAVQLLADYRTEVRQEAAGETGRDAAELRILTTNLISYINRDETPEMVRHMIGCLMTLSSSQAANPQV